MLISISMPAKQTNKQNSCWDISQPIRLVCSQSVTCWASFRSKSREGLSAPTPKLFSHTHHSHEMFWIGCIWKLRHSSAFSPSTLPGTESENVDPIWIWKEILRSERECVLKTVDASHSFLLACTLYSSPVVWCLSVVTFFQARPCLFQRDSAVNKSQSVGITTAWLCGSPGAKCAGQEDQTRYPLITPDASCNNQWDFLQFTKCSNFLFLF